MALDLNATIEILKGKYDDVPDLRKKIVRIFLSSTFTDTNSERDFLIKNIYPKLKNYCRANYDIDFQAVDMRWGIPSDAYEYHGTTELCLKEILNCKEVSVGPNFVTIVGQKYGLRPLPTKINSEEFELIVSQIEPEDILSIHFEPEPNVVFKLDNIILACYRLDTNQVPCVNRLLPISKIVPTYLSEEPKLREHSQIFWEKLKNKLSILLRILADRAFNKQLIDKVERDRYFVSITEKEIYSGIMKDKDPDSNCLCFIRNIENLDQNLDDQSIGRFTDVIKSNGKIELDMDAKKLMTVLIDEKIGSKLNTENIEKFNVKWSNNKIENLEVYLESFGNAFYRQIIRLVDRAMERIKNEEKWLNEIYFELGLTNKVDFDSNNVDQKAKDLISEFKNFVTEISHHAIEYSEIIGKYFGREHLTVKIRNYLLNDSNYPFIITGESGCGKTSVVGIVHKSIPEWFEKNTNIILITRFLGTTVQTSSIFKTYSSIALQLFYNINLMSRKFNHTIYANYSKCQDILSIRDFIYEEITIINNLDPTKKIIIILDSLDQLAPSDYKTTDKWLLTNLATNVKLMCSTLPDHGNIFDMINRIISRKYKEKMIEDIREFNRTLSSSTSVTLSPMYEDTKFFLNNQILDVKSLTGEESELILKSWLISSKKQLTESQWNDLRTIFNKANLLPLFLKLIYDIVVHCRSYENLDEQLKNCLIIDDLILYMFKRMEKIHGSTIVRRSLSYMTVCKNGISDSELDDILSLDDDVLYSVFQFHMPPVRRIPQILWLRIKNDLHEYIVEKEANDTKVIYWYHRRFIEVALDKYVQRLEKNEFEAMFLNIFDFYNETWKDKQKPFEMNQYLMKKLNKSSKQDQADRLISSQPIKYVAEDGRLKYNKRKLTELPNCLTNLHSSMSLEKACQLVFFNYEFMHAKFVCESINEIMDDLQKVIDNEFAYGRDEKSKSLIVQLKYLSKCLRLCGWSINDSPNTLGYELTSRCLNVYGSFDYISSFIDQCDQATCHCSLVSPYLQNQIPGSYLVSSIAKHAEKIIEIFILSNLYMVVSSKKISLILAKENDLYTFLFDIYIPDINQRKNEIKVKLLFSKSILTDYFEENKVNPETLSIQFLIIRSDLCFIIDLNSRVVFLYESELEILDAFSLNLSQLLVVEKSTKIIKLFSNYLIGSRKFSEILVADYNDSNFIESIACSSPLYQNENCTEIDLTCLFRKGDIKLILISFQVPINHDSDSDSEYFYYFLSDNVTIRFDSESDSNLSTDEDSDSEIEKRLKFNRINKHIEFTILKTIKSMGPKVERLIKIQSASYAVMKSFDRLNLTRTYISFTNGDLMILNLNARKKNRTLAYVFQNLCPEPILKIEHSLSDDLCLVLYTKSSIYLAHSNAKQDEYGKQKGLCLFELKGNCDQVLYLNRNMYLVSSHGIIEGFKLNCLMNRHRTKHLFSINTQSKQVTKLLISGASLECGTIDGVFNIFNIFFGKSKVNILPSFDRASDTILKFYHLESLIISSSKNNEISLWNLKRGKLESNLKIDDHELNGNVRKLKFLNEKKIVVLMDNFEIGFFHIQNFKIEFIKKISFGECTADPSNLIFLQNPTNESFEVFDLINLKKYQIKLDPEHLATQIATKKLSDFISLQNFTCYFQHLDLVIIIDKFICFFIQDQKQTKIRFSSSKYEKMVKKFHNLYSKANSFKYKILSESVTSLIVSVSVQKEEKTLNSLIIYFKIISANDRTGKSIELEVIGVFQGQKYQLVQDPSLYLCVYTGYKIEKDFLLDPDRFELENKDDQNSILLHDLVNDKILSKIIIDGSLNSFCLDQKLNYLVYSNDKKVLSLIRLGDCQVIGKLKLYGEDNSIKFSKYSPFVSLAMYDRRLVSLLIVDQNDKSQMEELKSLRLSLREENSKKDNNTTEIIENLIDSDFSDEMDSTNDETSTDDEVDSVEIKRKSRKKSSIKTRDIKIDDPRIKLHDKRVEFPIELKNHRMDKIDWLQNYLAKYGKLEKCREESISSQQEIINQMEEESDTDNEDLKKFGNELRKIIGTGRLGKSELKLQNSGLHARAANNSTKACLIS